MIFVAAVAEVLCCFFSVLLVVAVVVAVAVAVAEMLFFCLSRTPLAPS